MLTATRSNAGPGITPIGQATVARPQMNHAIPPAAPPRWAASGPRPGAPPTGPGAPSRRGGGRGGGRQRQGRIPGGGKKAGGFGPLSPWEGVPQDAVDEGLGQGRGEG